MFDNTKNRNSEVDIGILETITVHANVQNILHDVKFHEQPRFEKHHLQNNYSADSPTTEQLYNPNLDRKPPSNNHVRNKKGKNMGTN